MLCVFAVLCFSLKRYVGAAVQREGKQQVPVAWDAPRGLWLKNEREFYCAASLGSGFRNEACVLSFGAGPRASRTPASHGGISPGRNGHSTGNPSGKRHVYPGAGNEDSGGGAQRGIRRKTSSLCSLRITGGAACPGEARRGQWGACAVGTTRGGLELDWKLGHPSHGGSTSLSARHPLPQICRKNSLGGTTLWGNDGKGLLRIIKEKAASTIRDGWAKWSPWRMTIPPGVSSSSLNDDRPEQEKTDTRKKPFQAFLSHILRETGKLNNGKPVGTCAIVTEITQILSVRQVMVKWSAEQPDGHTHTHTHTTIRWCLFAPHQRTFWTFQMAKWMGIYLSTQGIWVWSLAQEDPPGSRKIPQDPGRSSSVCRNYWIWTLEPTCCNFQSPHSWGMLCSNKKPAHQN